MSYYCYVILSDCKKRTYIGKTNNLERRLKQHNGILSGGAKATKGRQWDFFAYVTGFETESEVLSFEWWLKHPYGKRYSKLSGVNGKIKALNIIIKKWLDDYDHNLKLFILNDHLEEINKYDRLEICDLNNT